MNLRAIQSTEHYPVRHWLSASGLPARTKRLMKKASGKPTRQPSRMHPKTDARSIDLGSNVTADELGCGCRLATE